MHDGEFEWDDRKAVDNYTQHGVSFEVAREAFNDPFAIERLDDREAYGEERYVLIGMVEEHLLFVAYTLRVRFKTSSRITELSQHEANGREFQEREGVAVEIFPVLGEAAATVEPRNGAFDNPTLGKLHEPFRLVGSSDDFGFETG
jgi:uncharacterized DUF497 family protein